MVESAASKWIPIISDVPKGNVLGPLLFILYTSEMFELVKNRLFANANDYTQMGVVRKPAVPLLTGTWLGFRSGAITGA